MDSPCFHPVLSNHEKRHVVISVATLQSARLLDQVRERIRYLHYSLRTEESYLHWIRAFIRFHGRRHPRELGGEHIEAFLMWLANERGVAVSTHRQALSALLFLYQKVLGLDLPWMQSIGRPQRKARLPVVLSRCRGACVGAAARRASLVGANALWHGHAYHRSLAVARQGC